VESNVLTCDHRVDELPLGRRIAEILADKGILPLEFSRRLGWGKDLVYECLDGKRYIKPSELEQIAEKLGLTISRIKQADSKDKAIELRFLVKTQKATKTGCPTWTRVVVICCWMV
jgi:hypothetical protein